MLALSAEQTPRQRRRRHQIRRKLGSLDRIGPRLADVLLFVRERERGEQHGTAALQCQLVDRPRISRALHGLQRPRPISGETLEFDLRLARPGKRWVVALGFLGDRAGGTRIVASPGLDIKPAQAQEPGLRPAEHGLELRLGALAGALELRRLSGQKQRQRLVTRELFRVRG